MRNKIKGGDARSQLEKFKQKREEKQKEYQRVLSMVEKVNKHRVTGVTFKEIKVLPPEISSMQKLRWFHIINSTIDNIPDEIGQMNKLEQLGFTACKNLKTLPPAIGQIQALKFLSLVNTPIEKLPIEIANSNIESINISGTIIETELSIKNAEVFFNKNGSLYKIRQKNPDIKFVSSRLGRDRLL